MFKKVQNASTSNEIVKNNEETLITLEIKEDYEQLVYVNIEENFDRL